MIFFPIISIIFDILYILMIPLAIYLVYLFYKHLIRFVIKEIKNAWKEK